MPQNRIGLVHAAIAEFLLSSVPASYACVGYDLSDCGVALKVHVLAGEDDPPERWRSLPLTANTLALNTVDVAGRGSAVRDVLHLLSVLGALKVSDYRPPRHPAMEFLHADWARLTPFGAWLARRPERLGPALRLAVLVAVWKPWTGPLSLLWRVVLRPLVLALGAFGGLQAVRDWLGV